VLLRAGIVFAVLSYVCMIVRPSTAAFSPDSWSYYDLSQTVFGDFYRPATTRSFHENDGYSRSFPPLWPVLIAAVHGSAASAVTLAAVAALLTVLPLLIILRACIARRALANAATLLTWLALLHYPPYWDEVHGGRAIPITVLLLCCAVAFLMARQRWWNSAGTGAALGLACLARFDALPFALLIVLCSTMVPLLRTCSRIALIAAFAATVSPWVAYSHQHYGSWWVSDNSSVAISAPAAYAFDYRAPHQTLRTHPVLWMKRIAANTVKLALALLEAISIHPGLALGIAGVAALWRSRRRHRGMESRTLQVVAIAAIFGLGAQVLTGYMDRRYFSFACTMATGCAVCFVLARTPRVRLAANTGILFLILVSAHSLIDWAKTETGARRDALNVPAEITTPVLADLECHELGAATRRRAVCLPSDWERLTSDEREGFVRRFSITHALIRSENQSAPFQIVPYRPDLNLRTR